MKKISVLIPCYNESPNISYAFDRLHSVLHGLDDTYIFEIVCVNDGSRDDTMAQLLQQAKISAYAVKIVDLLRNFGSALAITAGIHHTSGDAVWVVDADMQNAPELLPEFLHHWQQGCDVVYGKRIAREKLGFMRAVLTRIYYRLFNAFSQVHIPSGTSEFVLLDRRIVEIYGTFHEQDMFTKGIYAWIGGKHGFVEYVPEDRQHGTSTFSWLQLFKLAFQGLFGFSVVPLRFISAFGVVVSLVAFVYMMIRLVLYAVYGNPVQGYESTLVIILFIGGIQMLGMGILGEYVGRIYNETKNRPQYTVRKVHDNADNI